MRFKKVREWSSRLNMSQEASTRYDGCQKVLEVPSDYKKFYKITEGSRKIQKALEDLTGFRRSQKVI